MLTHCSLFLVCSFWSAWLSPSWLHCPCSSLAAQQGRCAAAGLIEKHLSPMIAQNWSHRHRIGIFYPLFFLSPLVADCCHAQRMSKAKFHSWSIAELPASSLPAPLAKANVCTSHKGEDEPFYGSCKRSQSKHLHCCSSSLTAIQAAWMCELFAWESVIQGSL